MKKMPELLASLPVLVFGLVPSLAFFAWIERNMALPWVGTWIGWPWIFVDGGPAASLVFDLALVAAFGIVHSALAGRARRSTYVIVAGVSAFLFMAAWQPTGVLLYQLIPSALASSIVSFVLYWGLMVLALRSLAQVEAPLRFVGFRAAESRSAGLWTGGLYGRVRHPLYFLTLLAWVATPMMSLDRLVFVVGMATYLAIGIRREERRLAAEFGDAYAAYRARTPMLVPRLGRRGVSSRSSS